MTRAIYEVLKKELARAQSKRSKLWDKLQDNHYASICDIRKGFADIVKKNGIMSQEAVDYAKRNAEREKELFLEAKYVNKNHDKIFNEVLELDRKISEFSQEIYLIKMRGKHEKNN